MFLIKSYLEVGDRRNEFFMNYSAWGKEIKMSLPPCRPRAKHRPVDKWHKQSLTLYSANTVGTEFVSD